MKLSLLAALLMAAAPWLGEEMPLPLAVRTPTDLAVKAVAERQYLIFNLIAGGKMAWDKGDFTTAAGKWESLLKLPNLDPDIDRAIRPLATQARAKAGGASSLPAAPVTAPVAPVSTASAASTKASVSGTALAGAVVWLKRTDGRTPRPSAGNKSMNQSNKTFVPHVLPVTVGSKVAFKNEDVIFHNVFSLSRPNDFDAGLYKAGNSYTRTFNTPGPVQILCNIHATMIGYVVVVDTPYYAQADGSGSFTIRGVPPGDYNLEAWHESASDVARAKVSVGTDGARVIVRMAGDRRPPTHVPDKYGKPRQAQLGY